MTTHNNHHAFSLQSFFLSLLVCCSLCLGTTHAQNHYINQFQPSNIIGAQGESYNVVTTPDGGFVTLDDVNLTTGNPGDHQFLTKMDADGHVLWSKELANTIPNFLVFEDAYQHMCRVGEGDFAMVGTITTPTTKAILVTRVDPNGHPKWSRAYRFVPMDSFGKHISSTEEGNLLVTGQIHQDTCSNDSDTDTHLDVFMKLEGNGNLIWQKSTASHCNDRNSWGFLTLETSTGNILYIMTDTEFRSAPDVMRISSYSQQGNLNWQKVISEGTENWVEVMYPVGIEETSNGEFILAVRYGESDQPTDVALIRFNASGNFVWQRTFDIDEDVRIELTSNDFIVMSTESGKVYNITSWGTPLQGHQFLSTDLSGMTKASNGDIVFHGKHEGNEEVDAFFTLIRGDHMGHNSCAESLELPEEADLNWTPSNDDKNLSIPSSILTVQLGTPDFDINGGFRCITAPSRKAGPTISSIQEPKLYPNPSDGKSVLELDAFIQSSKTVRVFSIQGQMMSQQQIPSHQNSLHLQVSSPGLYLIQVEQAGETFQKKWIVK